MYRNSVPNNNAAPRGIESMKRKKNATRPKTAGTVAILLTLLQEEAGTACTWAHAAKVLADLGAVQAVPALRRLARLSCEAEVRAAAREAMERITRERRAHEQDQPPGVLAAPEDRVAA